MKKITLTAGLVAAVAISLFAAGQASAQSMVQAGVLKNNMHIPMHYQLKLNNGEWVSFTLQPGQSHINTLPRTPGNHTLYIRFDRRIGDSVITMHQTTVVTHGCGRAEDGWLQCFILVNDGKDIMLTR